MVKNHITKKTLVAALMLSALTVQTAFAATMELNLDKAVHMFAGALTSNSVKINGEELTGLAFFLESSGGTRNKLNGTFHQKAGGDYEASLLLDLGEGLLQGTLNVTGGNVKSLLKMAKEEFAMEGLLDGKIVINKDGKGSGISITGKVNKSKIRSVPFKDIAFDLFYKRGLLQIMNMKAEEETGGFMAAQGKVDFKGRKIDLEIGCNKVNAAILTAFMAKPVELGGQMDFTAQLTGSLDNPNGNVSLQVTQGTVAGVSFDNLYGMVTLRDDMGITIYNMTNEYVDYNRDSDEIARYYKKRRGEEISFSRVTDNEFITNSVTLKNRDDSYVKPVSGYKYQYFEGYDLDGTQQSADVIAERQAQNFGLTRSVIFARTLDSRDNIYDPHEGKRNNYSVEVASFGGDFSFQKYSADYRYYYRQGVNNVIAVNLGVGFANGDMPLSQRFSVGGSDTLRGYRDDIFKGNSM